MVFVIRKLGVFFGLKSGLKNVQDEWEMFLMHGTLDRACSAQLA